ncbi:MAG: Asp-tRNA(Asn)/Glu-tRNA(Gln) amidotransferase subunit GatC [Candidatus Peribacteraceae bacterium]
MSHLNPEQVRHIAKLARLRLSDEEVAKFAPELSSILGYVDKLSEVNTEGVEPTAQITGLCNRSRADDIRNDIATPDALLATSPLPIADHQIVTPSAHG